MNCMSYGQGQPLAVTGIRPEETIILSRSVKLLSDLDKLSGIDYR